MSKGLKSIVKAVVRFARFITGRPAVPPSEMYDPQVVEEVMAEMPVAHEPLDTTGFHKLMGLHKGQIQVRKQMEIQFNKQPKKRPPAPPSEGFVDSGLRFMEGGLVDTKKEKPAPLSWKQLIEHHAELNRIFNIPVRPRIV